MQKNTKYLMLCDFRILELLMGLHPRCGKYSHVRLLTSHIIELVKLYFDPSDRPWLYYHRFFKNQYWTCIAFRKSNEAWMPLKVPQPTIENGNSCYYFPSYLWINGECDHIHNKKCTSDCQIKKIFISLFDGNMKLTIFDNIENLTIMCREWHMGDYDDQLEIGRDFKYHFNNRTDHALPSSKCISNLYDECVLPTKWIPQKNILTPTQLNNLYNGILITSSLAYFKRQIAMSARGTIVPEREILQFQQCLYKQLPKTICDQIDVLKMFL